MVGKLNMHHLHVHVYAARWLCLFKAVSFIKWSFLIIDSIGRQTTFPCLITQPVHLLIKELSDYRHGSTLQFICCHVSLVCSLRLSGCCAGKCGAMTVSYWCSRLRLEQGEWIQITISWKTIKFPLPVRVKEHFPIDHRDLNVQSQRWCLHEGEKRKVWHNGGS